MSIGGFSCQIPTPPSVNGLYANGKRGRYKTDSYKAWLHHAGWEVIGQGIRPYLGRYTAHLTLPKIPSNSDPDNRIKATLDLLVGLRLVDGDQSKFCRGVEVKIDPTRPKGIAEIRIQPVVQQ